MKDIGIKELIARQTAPLNADTTPTMAWHDDMTHCLNPALSWRAFDGEINARQASDSVGLALVDKTHEIANLLIYPNPQIQDNHKRPFTLETVKAQAVMMGEPMGETYAILGLENAVLLYDGLMARNGQACVYTLPNTLKNAFYGMIRAFKPNNIITTHDKADELKSKIDGVPAKVFSLMAELSQIATPATVIDADWLDGVLFDDVQISQTDAMTVIHAKKMQLQQTISHLASLDDMELHLSLAPIAKEFGLSKDKILSYVADFKRAGVFNEVMAYDYPVSGDDVYNELYRLIDEHMIIDEPLKVAFVLWVIFSYVVDIADFAPIAWITAPERACGKSTLLSLFERVVNKPITGASMTPAVLFRVVEKHRPTVLLDEIDTWAKDNNELLGLINAGHSRHAPYVWRYDQDEKTERAFNVFGAKVCSGIGAMKGTFASRAIKFGLRRKTNQDKAITSINAQTLPRTTTDRIKAKIKRWCDDNRQAIAGVQIDTIQGIDDRDFDNWYILLQIASVLGVYDQALQAYYALCKVEHEPSINEQLLSDIRDIMGNRERIGTTELLTALNGNDELQWATYNRGQPLSQYQLANRLKPFGIKSTNARRGQTVIKCYLGEHLQPVFERYLKPKAQDEPIENPFTQTP